MTNRSSYTGLDDVAAGSDAGERDPRHVLFSDIPEPVLALADEAKIAITAWKDGMAALSGPGGDYLGNYDEARAYLTSWIACARVTEPERTGRRELAAVVRRSILTVRSDVAIQAGEIAQVYSQIQVGAFRGERVAVPAEIASRFDVCDVLVGNRSQLPVGGLHSAEIYATRVDRQALLSIAADDRVATISITDAALAEFGRALTMDTCQRAMEVSFRVSLRGGQPPTRFEASILGVTTPW